MAKRLNLALMLLLELAVYGSIVYWGLHVSDTIPVQRLASVGGLIVFMASWIVLGSPKARLPLHRGVGRAVLELVWFGGGFALLAAAGPRALAAALFLVWLVNALLRWRWRQSASAMAPAQADRTVS
ncbi:MAG: YrdB family protein [Mycobacteriales bacterium]